MKNMGFLTYCLVGLLALNCCSCKKNIVLDETTIKPVIVVDDSIRTLLSDSVCDVVFNADMVELFELNNHPIMKVIIDSIKVDSLLKDSSYICPDSLIIQEIIHQDTLFHGYAIKKNWGYLNKEHVAPFLFLLSDRDAYLWDNNWPSAPFLAYMAMRFTSSERVIDIIFSFSGGFMQIYTGSNEYPLIKYNYERLFMRYFQTYLQDTTIQQILDN